MEHEKNTDFQQQSLKFNASTIDINAFSEAMKKFYKNNEPLLNSVSSVQEGLTPLITALNKEFFIDDTTAISVSSLIENMQNSIIENIDIEQFQESLKEIATQNNLSNVDELFEISRFDVEFNTDLYTDINDRGDNKTDNTDYADSENKVVNQIDQPFYKNSEWYKERVAGLIFDFVFIGFWQLSINNITEVEFWELINDLILFLSQFH